MTWPVSTWGQPPKEPLPRDSNPFNLFDLSLKPYKRMGKPNDPEDSFHGNGPTLLPKCPRVFPYQKKPLSHCPENCHQISPQGTQPQRSLCSMDSSHPQITWPLDS